MYYVKTTIGSTTIMTEINDETVFTRCPHCGAEIPVDLQAHISAGDLDVYGDTLFCARCAALAKRKGVDVLTLMSEHFPEEEFGDGE